MFELLCPGGEGVQSRLLPQTHCLGVPWRDGGTVREQLPRCSVRSAGDLSCASCLCASGSCPACSSEGAYAQEAGNQMHSGTLHFTGGNEVTVRPPPMLLLLAVQKVAKAEMYSNDPSPAL